MWVVHIIFQSLCCMHPKVKLCLRQCRLGPCIKVKSLQIYGWVMMWFLKRWIFGANVVPISKLLCSKEIRLDKPSTEGLEDSSKRFIQSWNLVQMVLSLRFDRTMEVCRTCLMWEWMFYEQGFMLQWDFYWVWDLYSNKQTRKSFCGWLLTKD